MAFSQRRKVRPSKQPSFRPCMEILEGRLLPSTLMVTSTADSGPNTLRQAITTADAQAGPTTIDFAIASGPQTIALVSPLPAITEPVLLDGTTQPGYSGTPLIVVTEGSSFSGPGDGLALQAAGSTIQGLMITGFTAGGVGIAIAGNNNTIGAITPGAGNVVSGNGTGVSVSGTGNVIEGNLIGTDAAGSAALANTGDGILVNNAADNTIGGTVPGARNVISGNGGDGIDLESSLPGFSAAFSGTVIEGNYIGTNAAGSAAVPNQDAGVAIFYRGGPPATMGNTTIGGSTSGAGNLISGNKTYGIRIAETFDNVIQGNLIGTDAGGTVALGNGMDGIALFVSEATIGGTTPGAGNLISGNGVDGIHLEQPTSVEEASNSLIQGNKIGTNLTGMSAVPNAGQGIELDAAVSNTIGGTTPGAGNLISGNGQNGILVQGHAAAMGPNSSANNLVEGNLIGLGAAGAVLPNGLDGVEIGGGTTETTIGGTIPGAGNTISGNGRFGVLISAQAGEDNGAGTQDNIVQGNQIGTNPGGSAAVPNGANGVAILATGMPGIYAAMDNTIGGTVAGAGNVISGNADYGILLALSSGNLIQGNMVGTDRNGTVAVANGLDGIYALAASGNTIAGNLISGNGRFGVFVLGEATDSGVAAPSSNNVQDNKIGTDTTGTVAVPNVYDGIYVIGASGSTIAGNLISGNGRFGVFLLGQPTASGMVPSSNNLVQDNIIGLGQGAGGLANADDGVALFAGSTDNTIGGTTPGDGNLISGNYRFGIYLNGSGTSGNVIQGNRIGTSVNATFGQGNSFDGIAVFVGPTDNTIGGTTAGAGNVISGNGRNGIFLADAGTSGNVVQGNLIGTSGSGTASLGHNGTGVAILVASDNAVGGTTAGAGNVISGNAEGVALIDSGASGNVVQGNLIGTDLSGSLAVPNTAFGVSLGSGASDNTVGGTVSGAGNTIAFNGSSAVVIGTSVSDNTTVGDAVLGNAIFSNGGVSGLGIDLANDGVTANGAGGVARSGPNDLQNHPVFTPATATMINNTASATLSFSSLAGSTFRLEFFLNSATDVSPQGRTFLGAVQVSTDANGNLLTATALTAGVSVGTVNTGNNTVSVSLPVPAGTLTGSLTSTATVLTVGSGTVGDTSEFSAPALIGP